MHRRSFLSAAVAGGLSAVAAFAADSNPNDPLVLLRKHGSLARHENKPGKPIYNATLMEFDHEIASALATLPDLERIKLWGPKYLGAPPSNEDVRPLIRLKKLREVQLHTINLSDVGIEILTRCKSLEVVAVQGAMWDQPTITDKSLAHFATLTRLRDLTVRSPGITGRGIDKLSKLESFTSLTFFHAKLTSEGARGIAAISRLRELEFHGCSLPDDLATRISGHPNLALLHVLGRRGLKEYAPLAKLKSLRRLVLISATISPAQLKEIATLRQLEDLTLSASSIDDSMVDTLASMGHLRRLGLAATDISTESVEKIRQKNPKMTVFGP